MLPTSEYPLERGGGTAFLTRIDFNRSILTYSYVAVTPIFKISVTHTIK